MVFQSRDYLYALSLLQAADSLLPSQPDLLHDLAWAYFSVGKVAEARDSMQSALQTGAPFDKLNDARQFLEMTAAYSNPAQAQAAARVQRVLQADAGYAPALMARGLIQEQQGHGQGSGTVLRESLGRLSSLRPGRPPVGHPLCARWQ